MMQYKSNGTLMRAVKTALIAFCLLSFASHAELKDQGLYSVFQIIDKAIIDINSDQEAEGFDDHIVLNALEVIMTLSKTLGTMGYSRLQCGQAEVLAEFTQRVRKIPEEDRDQMRDAFQEGFDKSKKETVLLSDDECKRLTESRTREDSVDDAQVRVDEDPGAAEAVAAEEVVEEVTEDESRLRHMRIAELSGQMAFKTKICKGEQVFTRDYNDFMKTVPEEYQGEVKDTYWKGYKHGRRMNPNLTADAC